MTSEPDLIPMAYVRAAVGIKGWLKIKADTELADGLLDYPRWFLGQDGVWQEYAPHEGKVTPDGFQAKLVGIDDRTAAEALRGMTIAVPRADFAEPEEDEYYWVDLIGMSVVNPAGVRLGMVSGLNESGAHDLLVVEGEHGTLLIPFVERFIQDVNRDTQTITADWEADY
ncbi:MAG: ribosome maturation factor RimM [Neisseria sp.]|nr:ribosome maturation factor RimM [Neisseria sp.]